MRNILLALTLEDTANVADLIVVIREIPGVINAKETK
jgi:hypothetical protein